jgi:RNA polymerase sigma-70 factor (ECF subfamily)
MSESTSFQQVMARLQAGDQDAAAEVFRRFANRLIGLARTHLDHRIRPKVDPEDVMQSALKSFFLRHADGQFDLSGWDNLWTMLVVITLRKCGHKVEHFRAAMRDVGREQAPPPPLSGEDSAASWEAVARDPSPQEAAMLAEAVEQVLLSLGDDRERQILELALQGSTTEEISKRVGRSERTVQRVLERVRERLKRMRKE